ncbi:MAG: hypothetical protein Q7U45_06450 [Burkholderiaceae bacterium]|nr:hypothetical protein [Burkholderiaceae bacterium]
MTFAIPDHSWADSGNGAALRIAMIAWVLATGGALEDRPRYNKTRCFETFPFPDKSTGLTPELRQRTASLAQQIDDHRKRVLGLPLVSAQTPASVGSGQAGAVRADLGRAAGMRPEPPPPDTAPPGPSTPSGEATTSPLNKDLTLSNLYNVREALRAGRALTAKEKAIHTTGLVGVLHQLHTELDAALLQAYGWADLTTALAAAPGAEAHTAATADLLQRLVALNTRRAAEEAQGTVRWLRPDFQNPAQNFKKTSEKLEQVTLINKSVEHFFVDEMNVENNSGDSTHNPALAAAAVAASQPWPRPWPLAPYR